MIKGKGGKALVQQADGLKKLSGYKAAAAEATMASSHYGRNRTLPVSEAASEAASEACSTSRCELPAGQR